MGVNAFEVWTAEPRDEAWAQVMEALLRPRLEADLAVMVTGPVEGGTGVNWRGSRAVGGCQPVARPA
jgi:hypothetical protein